MKFAKTVVYVEDAKASLEFFEQAFGLKTRAFFDQGFGEVETGGDTTIAFANYPVRDEEVANGSVVSTGSGGPPT